MWRSATLYLSRAIIRTKADYYRRLHLVTTKGQWAEWTAYMVAMVAETATWTTAKVRSVKTLMETTTEHVKREAPKRYSRELVELLFTQPYCRISNVVEAGIAQRQAASEYLKELCDVGVLNEVKAGRKKLFINPRLMKLLTAEDYEVPAFPATKRRR
jgi:Fic family protein